MSKTLMDFVKPAIAAVNNISADDLLEMIDDKDNLLILDIREESEYAVGHLPKAHLVPRGILEGAADKNYPKRDAVLCEARQRPIVCYCATGGRSAMAANTLQKMGFEEVYNLAGGIETWAADDNPIEK